MPGICGSFWPSGDALVRAGQKLASQGLTTLRVLRAEAEQACKADLAELSKVRSGIANAVVFGPSARAVSSLVEKKQPKGPDAGTFEDLVKREPGNYVFLFNIRSPANIDWSNPTALAWSSGLNGILKGVGGAASGIGHAQVGWVCTDERGNVITGGAGQSGQHGGEGAKVGMQGWGLNVLNTVYLDGVLENRQDVLDRTRLADAQQGFSWMAIKTDYAICKKMIDFVAAFDKSGCAKNYGFPVDPLKFEGAGCTSFAEAAFEKTGLDVPIFAGSKRELKLPSKYLGVRARPVPNTRPPALAASSHTEQKVPFTELILTRTRWATASEPHQDFAFYDPDLYHESAVTMENVYRGRVEMPLKSFARTATPDPAQARARQVSADWIGGLLKNHVPVTIGKIHHTTGLIVDLTAPAGQAKQAPAARHYPLIPA